MIATLDEELLAALGVPEDLVGLGATVDARLLIGREDLLGVGADAVLVVVLVRAGRAALGAAVVPAGNAALVYARLFVGGELLP